MPDVLAGSASEVISSGGPSELECAGSAPEPAEPSSSGCSSPEGGAGFGAGFWVAATAAAGLGATSGGALWMTTYHQAAPKVVTASRTGTRTARKFFQIKPYPTGFPSGP